MYTIMENEVEREAFRDIHDAQMHLSWCKSHYPAQASAFWILAPNWEE